MNSHSEQNNGDPASKKGLFSSIFHYLFHGEPKNREELVALIRDSEQNELIDNDTRDMLEGVMKIAELRVRDIMVPRSQIITLKVQQTLDECLNVIIKTSHSRFPVVSDDKDHIYGLLIAKDLLPFMRSFAEPFSIEKVLRQATVVPESKRIDQMLKEFRSQRYHMAIVVDEFGSISGLVTIEDILEEIVGEIEDEYDRNDGDGRNIREVSLNLFSVSALTTIEDFNQFFGTNYSDEEVDTIGGLVLQSFGHLPKHGELVTINGFQFKVSLSDSRHLIQLLVTKPPEPNSEQCTG